MMGFIRSNTRSDAQAASRASRKCVSCGGVTFRFLRNFGKEAALYAGLKQQAKGDFVTVMDADLQRSSQAFCLRCLTCSTQNNLDCVGTAQSRSQRRA